MITDLAFSPDGERLAAVLVAGGMRLYAYTRGAGTRWRRTKATEVAVTASLSQRTADWQPQTRTDYYGSTGLGENR